ncbi:hypothetical protein RJ639_011960 [Escallonia herrerae]|uniref:Uncharacterized protein n=1 Tax=Escallonia herrerae TaxID=1293975 RepID=A0AA89APL8_9ASTE|nr:hypothetical protein RJ639_011960 [Escallonia herrerae]
MPTSDQFQIFQYFASEKNITRMHLSSGWKTSSYIHICLQAHFFCSDGVASTNTGVYIVCRLLHLILLAFNALLIQSLSALSGGGNSIFAQKQNARALLLVASQKTLPVMVAVVEQLGGAFGESGLLVLPCVAAHFNQTVIDSFLVSSWLQKDDCPATQRPSET